MSRLTLGSRLVLSLAMRSLRDPPSLLRAGRDLATAWRRGGRTALRAAAGSALLDQEVAAGEISATRRYARWIAEHELSPRARAAARVIPDQCVDPD